MKVLIKAHRAPRDTEELMTLRMQVNNNKASHIACESDDPDCVRITVQPYDEGDTITVDQALKAAKTLKPSFTLNTTRSGVWKDGTVWFRRPTGKLVTIKD
jgi:hypothetical protein